MIDYNAPFSPPDEAIVRAIRDVLLVPTSDIDDDEVWELHPPAGDPPVELGRGVRLTQELAGPQAEEIMYACEPRGKNFDPARTFGCVYAFVRDLPADEYISSYAHWDHDQALLAALTLSRLILDNAYSTEYAARVVEFADDHVQIIPGPVNLEGGARLPRAQRPRLARRRRSRRARGPARQLLAARGAAWGTDRQRDMAGRAVGTTQVRLRGAAQHRRRPGSLAQHRPAPKHQAVQAACP